MRKEDFDLITAVVSNELIVQAILEQGGLPVALVALSVCTNWAKEAKDTIKRWDCLHSEWTRTGARNEDEWIGNRTDDFIVGDFDSARWPCCAANWWFRRKKHARV